MVEDLINLILFDLDRKRIISVVQREILVPLYLAEKVGGNVAFGIVPTLRVYLEQTRTDEPVAR